MHRDPINHLHYLSVCMRVMSLCRTVNDRKRLFHGHIVHFKGRRVIFYMLTVQLLLYIFNKKVFFNNSVL